MDERDLDKVGVPQGAREKAVFDATMAKEKEALSPTERKAAARGLIEPEPIMQFFAYEHLPDHLKIVSAMFFHLAVQITETLPRNAERTVALRKLLESKDAAVRARLAK